MKKSIVIAIVIILLGVAGYVFVAKKSANRGVLQPTSQKQTEVLPQPSPITSIDTNDNLDQALQDLNQVE